MADADTAGPLGCAWTAGLRRPAVRARRAGPGLAGSPAGRSSSGLGLRRGRLGEVATGLRGSQHLPPTRGRRVGGRVQCRLRPSVRPRGRAGPGSAPLDGPGPDPAGRRGGRSGGRGRSAARGRGRREWRPASVDSPAVRRGQPAHRRGHRAAPAATSTATASTSSPPTPASDLRTTSTIPPRRGASRAPAHRPERLS